jgi:hypothetical protein
MLLNFNSSIVPLPALRLHSPLKKETKRRQSLNTKNHFAQLRLLSASKLGKLNERQRLKCAPAGAH